MAIPLLHGIENFEKITIGTKTEVVTTVRLSLMFAGLGTAKMAGSLPLLAGTVMRVSPAKMLPTVWSTNPELKPQGYRWKGKCAMCHRKNMILTYRCPEHGRGVY